MMTIVYISMGLLTTLFLANLYLFFFHKPSENKTEMFSKWKIALLIFTISLLAFFIYVGSASNSLSAAITTTSDGIDTFTTINQEYLNAITFMPLMSAMILMNFVFLCVHILVDFKVFTQRGRMKKSRYSGF